MEDDPRPCVSIFRCARRGDSERVGRKERNRLGWIVLPEAYSVSENLQWEKGVHSPLLN